MDHPGRVVRFVEALVNTADGAHVLIDAMEFSVLFIIVKPVTKYRIAPSTISIPAIRLISRAWGLSSRRGCKMACRTGCRSTACQFYIQLSTDALNQT